MPDKSSNLLAASSDMILEAMVKLFRISCLRDSPRKKRCRRSVGVCFILRGGVKSGELNAPSTRPATRPYIYELRL